MMGHEKPSQDKLFSYNVDLDKRVRKGHILRKINEQIDFDFIYDEVEDSYGPNGNVSVPPPVTLKIICLLFLYNVRSERELMATIPERLDWLWFLGYTLDDQVANHSVISKARARWGVDAFKKFFERIVWQCVEAGLVDGSKLFVDSSLIDADASNNSVVKTASLRKHLNKSYRKLEERLDDITETKQGEANSKYISTTDPDASVSRYRKGRSKLRYKTHRGVDPKQEIITATKITTGAAYDGEQLEEMINIHQKNTQRNVDTVVADSAYGTISNYLDCHDQGIKAHMPSVENTQKNTGRREGIFSPEAFSYDPETDIFTCPAGQILKCHHYYKNRKHYEYRTAKGTCDECVLRAQCTRAKDGRSLKRHDRQEILDLMLKQAKSGRAKKDIKKRKDLAERTFARGTRYGYKRSRWRRLWRVQIQDYLIAAIQNIIVLVNSPNPKKVLAKAERMQLAEPRINGHTSRLSRCLKVPWWRKICRGRLLVFLEPRPIWSRQGTFWQSRNRNVTRRGGEFGVFCFGQQPVYC